MSDHCEMSREIRATYNDKTIRVYQAYNNTIANAALENQRFVPPWSSTRMTWIKPSAVWMGYRSGWGKKDLGQSRILALDLHRTAFDELLLNAVPARSTTTDRTIIVQWDPERKIGGEAGREAYTSIVPGVRSLQMGLSGEASAMLTVRDGPLLHSITDMTSVFQNIGDCLENNDFDTATTLLNTHCPERLYHPVI